MKLTAFHAGDGDCLLVQDGHGFSLLVDGGRVGSFREHTTPLLSALRERRERLDVVCVSHDDGDHIGGVLAMVDDLIEWRVYSYQRGQGNDQLRSPEHAKPPEIGELWHNTFQDLLPEDFRAIRTLLSNALSLVGVTNDQALQATLMAFEGLHFSERQSLELSRLVGRSGLRLPVNMPARGRLMQVSRGRRPITAGEMHVRVLGPRRADLTTLRKRWKKWLRNNQHRIDEIRRKQDRLRRRLGAGEVAEWAAQLRVHAQGLADRDEVTPPNLASLMLLVEHNARSLVLTGDGHQREVIKGLQDAGKQLPLNVDVLKVPHHGSEFNSDDDLYRKVTAEHYVICANGAHENPNTRVIDDLIGARLERRDLGSPFHLWFTSHPDFIDSTDRKQHMKKVMHCVARWRNDHPGRFEAHYLRNSSFEIDLGS